MPQGNERRACVAYILFSNDLLQVGINRSRLGRI
jgi:hypothetical protein